jgi:hypothetical protein
MIQARQDRGKTWATVALFAVGAHGGMMIHAWLDREHCEHHGGTAPLASAVETEPPVRCVAARDQPSFDTACFVDPAALAAERMPFPRGLRLVPSRGGLRLDGARGLTRRLGLRSGDILLAIDDHRLRDGQDLDILPDAVDRGAFTLRFRRADREHGVRITIVGRDR